MRRNCWSPFGEEEEVGGSGIVSYYSMWAAGSLLIGFITSHWWFFSYYRVARSLGLRFSIIITNSRASTGKSDGKFTCVDQNLYPDVNNVLLEAFGLILAGQRSEGRLAMEHLIHQHPQTPNIQFFVVAGLIDHFGGQIVVGATVGGTLFVGEVRPAEVSVTIEVPASLTRSFLSSRIFSGLISR